MQISFERATAADADALVRVQIAAFHNDDVLYPGVGLSGPPGYDSVAHIRERIETDLCYKITDAGQVIGVIVVFDRGEGHFHLDLIAIEPAYHNRGVGTRALQFIERAHAPAARWTLDTPSWAVRNQHVYEKFGFVKVGEEALPDITLFAYEKRYGPGPA